MYKDIQTIREDLRKFAIVKTNELRRILLDDQNKKTFTKNGLSLNGRGIVNTAIAIANGRENLDRYKTFQNKQTTLAGFSFAFDFSGSMKSGGIEGIYSFLPRYEALVYAVESLFEQSRGRDNKRFETSTDRFQICLKVIKRDTEKFDINRAFTGTQPKDSTYLCAYAQGAIEMAKRIKGVDKRIAIYMTDGEDWQSLPFLKSIQDQAKSEGVELICAVLDLGLDERMIESLKAQEISN
jgi:hypothetical protein